MDKHRGLKLNSTGLNIADLLSRGILLDNPNVMLSWFTGPNFMKQASSIINFELSENGRNAIEQQQQLSIKSLTFTHLK